MILNSKSSNFFFVFPRGFFPDTVTEKYLPYMKRQPSAYETIAQMMNSSIQSINFPELQATTVEQTRYLGKKVVYKSAAPVQDLFSRNFQVTFRLVDGYLNYFVMLDTLLYFLNFKNPKVHSMDLVLRMMDNEGNLVANIGFKESIILSISSVDLNYTQNNPTFSTFTLSFTCNFLDIQYEPRLGV